MFSSIMMDYLMSFISLWPMAHEIIALRPKMDLSILA